MIKAKYDVVEPYYVQILIPMNYMNMWMNPTIKVEPDYSIMKYLEELKD